MKNRMTESQAIVNGLKCKVKSSLTKISWTLLELTPSHLLLGKLPYDLLLLNNIYYLLLDESRKLAKEKTITYHNKKNLVKFKVSDAVIYTKNSIILICIN